MYKLAAALGAMRSGALLDALHSATVRESRAGEERAVASALNDHVCAALGADLISFLVDVTDAGNDGLRGVDALAERAVELSQDGHPFAFAAGDVVKLLLNARGEVQADDLREILGEEA